MLAFVSHLSEALVAIDRAIVRGLKGDLRLNTTRSANNIMVFPLRPWCASTAAPGSAAGRTTAGLVDQSLGLVEFLLAGRENKVGSAVAACQGLVCKHYSLTSWHFLAIPAPALFPAINLKIYPAWKASNLGHSVALSILSQKMKCKPK